MTVSSSNPRRVKKDVFDHLDPLEKIIGTQFILEGKWIIENGDLTP